MLVLDNVVICVIVSRIMVKNNVKAKKYATFWTYKTKCNLVKLQHTKILNYDYILYMIKYVTCFSICNIKKYNKVECVVREEKQKFVIKVK